MPSHNGSDKIVRVELRPVRASEILGANGTVRVLASFEDGVMFPAFDYYDDEISFSENELVGLTLEQALELKFKKDIDYLRS